MLEDISMWSEVRASSNILELYKARPVMLKSHYDYRYIYKDYGVGHFGDFEHSLDVRCRCEIKPINEEEEKMSKGIKKGVRISVEEVYNGFIVRPDVSPGGYPSVEQILVFNTNDQLKKFIDEHYEEGNAEKEKKPRRIKKS